jgi:hypothetical protein
MDIAHKSNSEGDEKDPATFPRIRKLQTDLLQSYHADFSKHSGKANAMHISSVFENIPLQLADNMDGSIQRFRFKNVVKGKKGFAQLAGPILDISPASILLGN